MFWGIYSEAGNGWRSDEGKHVSAISFTYLLSSPRSYNRVRSTFSRGVNPFPYTSLALSSLFFRVRITVEDEKGLC